ncbi:MAG: hypothetical protein Fur0042_12530 [Cyanophyceae cyanobacterium]
MATIFDVFPNLVDPYDSEDCVGFWRISHGFPVNNPDYIDPNTGETRPGGPADITDPAYTHKFIAAGLKVLHEYYTPERRETEGTPIEFDPNIETRIESIPQVNGTTIVTTRYQVQEMTIRFYREISLPEFDPNAF